MTDYYFFGAKASITVGADPIAATKEWGFTWKADHVEEYDNDSILRGDVARIKARVEVKLKWGKWNPTVTSWIFRILNPTAADGTVEDTNEVALFDVSGTVHPKGAPLVSLIAAVEDVYFESLPILGQENVYNPMDISGIGRTVAFSNA